MMTTDHAPPLSLDLDSEVTLQVGRIRLALSDKLHVPSKAEIKRATVLAWEGHLTSLERMRIWTMSITDIPRDHMEKLTSIVTGTIWIASISHADQLGGILASVKCKELQLGNLELSEEETKTLVTAMMDRVQLVELGREVTLDIEEFTQYDGQGRCSELGMEGNLNWGRYGYRLREWAADKGWTVTRDDGWWLGMKRATTRGEETVESEQEEETAASGDENSTEDVPAVIPVRSPRGIIRSMFRSLVITSIKVLLLVTIGLVAFNAYQHETYEPGKLYYITLEQVTKFITSK